MGSVFSLPPPAVVLVESLDVMPNLISFLLCDADLFLQLVVSLELFSLLLDKKCPRQVNFLVRGRSGLRSFEASLQEFGGVTGQIHLRWIKPRLCYICPFSCVVLK